MAYIDAQSFVYDGISSDYFNLAIGWFKSDNKQVLDTGLEMDVKRGEVNMVRNRPNQYGATYTDTLKFEFCVFNKSRQKFTYEESRELNKWLNKSRVYKKFYFDDRNSELIYYYAICTKIEDAVYSGINAKKLTFICDSPYGYTQEIKKKLTTSSNTTQEFRIQNLSDCGIYYPKITISVDKNYSDVFKMENIGDDRTLKIDFSGVDAVDNIKTVVINGQQNKMTDSFGQIIPAYKIGWDNTDYIYWFRLLEETNYIRITGKSTVTFQMEFPRKVGMV